MTEEAQNLGFAMYRDSLVTDRRVLFDRYQFVDWAVKVVGVGSVGLIAAVVLLDEGADEDPVFLQVKQAEASVLERFLGPSTYATSGERVVAGPAASSRPRPTCSSAGLSDRRVGTSTSGSSRTRRAAP